MTLLPVSIWQYGYFSIANSSVTSGYGNSNANLNTLYNPSGWSIIFKDLSERPNDFEGFAYLGIGTLIIFCISILNYFLNIKKKMFISLKHKMLIVSICLMAIFAISPNIGINDFVINLLIPDFIMDHLNMFRANGRFIWPAYYLICIFSFYSAYRLLKINKSYFIFFAALMIQIYDMNPGLINLKFNNRNSEFGGTFSRNWVDLSKKYDKIRLIHPRNIANEWETVAVISSIYGFETDAVFLARINKIEEVNLYNNTRDKLLTQTLDLDTIYVVNEKRDLEIVKLLPKYNIMNIDDLTVILP